MPRRSDPEIKKYTLKSGKTKYMFKTYLGIDPETHKAKKISRSGFDSWTEAQSAKNKIKAKSIADLKNNQNKTLQQVWDSWYEVYKIGRRGSTILNMKYVWESHIQPEFADSYVNNIQPEHLQKYAIELSKELVTFKYTLNILHRLIKYAIKHDWCKEDPFLKIDIPKKSSKKSNHVKDNFYTSKAELKKFLNAIKEMDLMQYTYFVTIASLGLRSGEGFALKWENIDTKNKIVKITHTVTRDENGKWFIGPPKSKAGVRTLPLPATLETTLNEWKKEALYNQDEDFIFCKPNGNYFTTSISSIWLREFFQHHPDMHRITPHGLRHTLATIIYYGNDNVDPKDVQYLLGHSDVKTALDIYTHITEQNKKNISDSMHNLGL